LPINDSLLDRSTEAARLLGISVPTLDRRVKAGEIPAVKLRGAVMFYVDALREVLQGRDARGQAG
jgi:excisionase family DNA binding protein